MNLPVVRLMAASILLILSACGSRSSGDAQQAIAEVGAVIESQQASWNRGDIDGFMNGYDHAETTLFISGDEVTRGWQTVHDRYKKRYSSPELMGTLTFSDIEIRSLSPDYVLADGRWKLTRTNDAPFGRFSLLFQRTDSGWRIIHDTTTSATP